MPPQNKYGHPIGIVPQAPTPPACFCLFPSFHFVPAASPRPPRELCYSFNNSLVFHSTMHLSQFLPRGSRWPQPFLLRLQSFATTRPRPFYSTSSRLFSNVPVFATAFRARSIYVDCFPCTLHYYSSGGSRLSLYDGKKYIHDDDSERIQGDCVEVGDDGFVDPALTSWWNGISIFPNTLLRQQIWTNWGEWAEACREQGWEVAEPWIFTLSKGTKLFAVITTFSCLRRGKT